MKYELLKKFSNFILVFVSIIISLLIIYLSIYIHSYKNFSQITKYKFNDKEKLIFHEKYSDLLHHLRGSEALINSEIEKKELLFSTIKDFNSEKNNILIQGDSWAEQLTNVERKKFYLARDYVKELSEKYDFGLINAGIASYSPTLMKLQFQVLKKDFNINPDLLIITIDQSDIGDENCRYKYNRVVKNNKLVAVRKNLYSDKVFDYSKIYNISKITLSFRNKYIQVFYFTNFLIKYEIKKFLKKNYQKINLIVKSNFKEKKLSKCNWPEIERYLYNSSKEELNYFENSLKNYIKYVSKDKKIKKIIIVTFPHKKHLEKKFEINVSDIIENLFVEEEKIIHINFTKLINEKKINIRKETYFKNDPSSHLSDKFYHEVYIKTIFARILDNYLE